MDGMDDDIEIEVLKIALHAMAPDQISKADLELALLRGKG